MKVKDLKYLTNTEIKALNELKRKVLELEPSAKLILFGSKARGDFDEESDIDVLIIVPETKLELKYKIWNTSTNINLKYNTLITPIIIDKSKYLSEGYRFSIFFKNVKNEGILI